MTTREPKPSAWRVTFPDELRELRRRPVARCRNEPLYTTEAAYELAARALEEEAEKSDRAARMVNPPPLDRRGASLREAARFLRSLSGPREETSDA